MVSKDSPNPPNSDPTDSSFDDVRSTPLPSEISVQDVHELLGSDSDVVLLDCREPGEHAYCHLSGSVLIPMAEIPGRYEQLMEQKNDRIVVYCHLGGRSLQVVNWLRNHGFDLAQNMTGGIDAWSQEIDPNIPRY